MQKEILDYVIDQINELVGKGILIDLLSSKQQELFSLTTQKAVVGQIASGDKFFSSNLEKEILLGILPDVLCVEMEGAAVAQVCFEYDIPYVIIRIISDSANENSVVDFNQFIGQIASKFSVEIIQKLVK